MPVSSQASTRQYDSPLRRQRAVETRERIVEAGCRLLQQLLRSATGVRLTIRGVAEEAGVNERTVYRYFGNEKGLRDAVMHRLEQKAGIDLEGMRLEDVADIAARIFAHVSAYPLRPKPPLDPTLTDANLRQRRALFGALDDKTDAMVRIGPSRGRGPARCPLECGDLRTARLRLGHGSRSGDPGRHLGDRLGPGRGAHGTAAHVEPPKGLAGSTSVLRTPVATPRLACLARSDLLNDLVRSLDVELVPARPQVGKQVDELAPLPLGQADLFVHGCVQVVASRPWRPSGPVG